MKNVCRLFIACVLFQFHVSVVNAQVPQKLNYQAIVRNAVGAVVPNQLVGIRFSVHDGSANGTVVYRETNTDTTNRFGLFTAAIGGGLPVSGSFNAVNWGSGNKYLQVEVDIAGGSNYSDMGTSQLLSVPYALYAANSPVGATGPTGITGNTGAQGPTGATGADGAANAWGLAGNAGADATTSFVGTTDAQQLVFKVNNYQSGYIDFGNPYNTGFGYQTLLANTGDGNSAFGFVALSLNTAGYWNTAIGKGALALNTLGSSNTAIGYNTMVNNSIGYNNTATGSISLYNNTGNDNSGFGARTLASNTSGERNTATGSGALVNNTTGDGNSATGFQANGSNMDGTNNTAVGEYALFENVSGNSSTAVGGEALLNNRAGFNTCVGFRSGQTNHTGFNNTALGANSLVNNNTGSYNTAVGYNTGPNAAALDNTTTVGIDATATATDMVRIGNVFVSSIGGQVGWTTLSDGRFKENVNENVPGLSFITQLQPVTYRVNRDKINAFTGIKPAYKGEAMSPVTTGFIAQDVESVARKLGFNFSGVDAPDNANDYYGLRYAEFVVPLVKGMQEQQQMIEKQKANIELLKKEIEELKKK